MNKSLMVSILLLIILASCGETPYVQGKYLYDSKCSNCHQNGGEGLANLVPSLISDKSAPISDWTCIIVKGKIDTVKSEKSYLVKEMPSFKNLSPTELTNIINYINHSFRPNFRESTIKEIQEYLLSCKNVEVK